MFPCDFNSVVQPAPHTKKKQFKGSQHIREGRMTPGGRWLGNQPERSLGHHGQIYASSELCCGLPSLLACPPGNEGKKQMKTQLLSTMSKRFEHVVKVEDNFCSCTGWE